jgi:hypothetical protein
VERCLASSFARPSEDKCEAVATKGHREICPSCAALDPGIPPLRLTLMDSHRSVSFIRKNGSYNATGPCSMVPTETASHLSSEGLAKEEARQRSTASRYCRMVEYANNRLE